MCVYTYVASNFKCFKSKGQSLPENPKNGRNECNLVKTMYECVRNSLVKNKKNTRELPTNKLVAFQKSLILQIMTPSHYFTHMILVFTKFISSPTLLNP